MNWKTLKTDGTKIGGFTLGIYDTRGLPHFTHFTNFYSEGFVIQSEGKVLNFIFLFRYSYLLQVDITHLYDKDNLCIG